MNCPTHGDNCTSIHPLSIEYPEDIENKKIIQIVSHNRKLFGLLKNGKLIVIDTNMLGDKR